jgi:hypothetical protein
VNASSRQPDEQTLERVHNEQEFSSGKFDKYIERSDDEIGEPDG